VIVFDKAANIVYELGGAVRPTDTSFPYGGTHPVGQWGATAEAVCVLYDEGAPPGESWAAKNVVGEHYQALAASGAFHRAERFEEVVAGIERSLAQPAELAAARRRAVADIAGVVDGRAAERVVAAVLEAVPIASA